MNQRNYQYLSETLAGLGFGDTFDQPLKTKLNIGLEKFEILVDNKQSNGSYVRYAPQFQKGKNEDYSDYYFLNSITATHKDEKGNTLASADFNIFKKSGFSVDEMEKLLIDGRAIYREFRNDEGTMQGKYYRLDLNSPDENNKVQIISYSGKMNIERELDKLNINWSSKKEKEEAIMDLKSGEQVTVLVKEGRENMRISIESAPHKGGLAVLNSEGTVIKYTNSQSQNMQAVTELSQEKSQGMQVATGSDESKSTLGKTDNKAKEVLNAIDKNAKDQSAKNTNTIKPR